MGIRIAERYRRILERFAEKMPEAQSELNFSNPFELLVAVILSAQCTDRRVNQITPSLFKKFPTPHSLASASAEDVFELIKSCSYPNNKTRSLIGMARGLVDKFNGAVPDDMEALCSLPGVGRKTANVVLSIVYDRPAMAVDTHVFRVSERLGLTTRSRTPLATERTLVKYIPETQIPRAHHWLILHGRYVCKARKPECEICFLNDICRYNERKVKSEGRKSDNRN